MNSHPSQYTTKTSCIRSKKKAIHLVRIDRLSDHSDLLDILRRDIMLCPNLVIWMSQQLVPTIMQYPIR